MSASSEQLFLIDIKGTPLIIKLGENITYNEETRTFYKGSIPLTGTPMMAPYHGAKNQYHILIQLHEHVAVSIGTIIGVLERSESKEPPTRDGAKEVEMEEEV